MRDPRRRQRSSRRRLLTGTITRAGSLQWFYWLRRARASPERADGRRRVGRAGPHEVRRRPPVPRSRRPKRADEGRRSPRSRRSATRTRRGGPDGEGAPVRPQRPGRHQRRAGDLALLASRDETARRLTGPGYLHPSWSRDQKWIAATKTTAFGTDVVILNAHDRRRGPPGHQRRPLLGAGRSRRRGDAVAFLHTDGQIVDLHMVQLDGDRARRGRSAEPIALTELSGLDTVLASRLVHPGGPAPAAAHPDPAPVVRRAVGIRLTGR